MLIRTSGTEETITIERRRCVGHEKKIGTSGTEMHHDDDEERGGEEERSRKKQMQRQI